MGKNGQVRRAGPTHTDWVISVAVLRDRTPVPLYLTVSPLSPPLGLGNRYSFVPHSLSSCFLDRGNLEKPQVQRTSLEFYWLWYCMLVKMHNGCNIGVQLWTDQILGTEISMENMGHLQLSVDPAGRRAYNTSQFLVDWMGML